MEGISSVVNLGGMRGRTVLWPLVLRCGLGDDRFVA